MEGLSITLLMLSVEGDERVREDSEDTKRAPTRGPRAQAHTFMHGPRRFCKWIIKPDMAAINLPSRVK